MSPHVENLRQGCYTFLVSHKDGFSLKYEDLQVQIALEKSILENLGRKGTMHHCRLDTEAELGNQRNV